MAHRTCPVCGTEFKPTTHNQRFCPPVNRMVKGQPRSQCAKAYDNAERRGVLPELLARGRVGAAPFDCAQCGQPCTPGENVAPHATRFCGRQCTKAWHHWHADGQRPRTRAAAKLQRAMRGQRGSGVWYEHHCPECGQRSLARMAPRDDNGYCSTRCQRRQKRRRRRAREAGAGPRALSFHAIAERDQWRCQLCGSPVGPASAWPHPLAPTLDHIIPLAFGGTHDAANAQLAHFRCNSLKGDGVSATPAGGQCTIF